MSASDAVLRKQGALRIALRVFEIIWSLVFKAKSHTCQA